MTERPSEDIERHISTLQMLLESTEGHIKSARALLEVATVGHGDIRGDEWQDLGPEGRRLILLHAAQSASLEYARAVNELKRAASGMSSDAQAEMEVRLAGYQAEINVLAERLFAESEKYQ